MGGPGPPEPPDPPRYAVLTGSPPFEAAERQELFRRIRAARYPLPPNLSPRARALIARLLVPEPTARPSLPDVLAHGFFTQVGGPAGGHGPPGDLGGRGSLPLAPQGFTPARLSPRACHSVPIFVGHDSLRWLVRGAAVCWGGGGRARSTGTHRGLSRDTRHPPGKDPSHKNIHSGKPLLVLGTA